MSNSRTSCTIVNSKTVALALQGEATELVISMPWLVVQDQLTKLTEAWESKAAEAGKEPNSNCDTIKAKDKYIYIYGGPFDPLPPPPRVGEMATLVPPQRRNRCWAQEAQPCWSNPYYKVRKSKKKS